MCVLGAPPEWKADGSAFEADGEFVLGARQREPDALLSGQERPARNLFQDGGEFFFG